MARTAAPVTSGICLPRDTFPADQPFSLWDGETEIPLQTAPLVVETNGTLRWVLLDFQLSPGAGEKESLMLRTGAPHARPALSLRCQETGEYVTLDTGRLRLRVSKTSPFGLFTEAVMDGRSIAAGGEVDYVEARTGRRFSAGPPSSVAFESRGPLRATVRVDFTYACEGQPGLQGITRITAWAGRTDLRVQHILANSDREQVRHACIERASLGLRHSLGGSADHLLGAGGSPMPLSGAESTWLHQGLERRSDGRALTNAAAAGAGGETRWTGAGADGWIELRKGERGLWICDRDFSVDPPRRIEAGGERLTLDYVARKFPGTRGAPFRSDHLWLYDLSHRGAEVWMDFAPAGDPAARARAARARLVALAPPSWYSQCDAFGVGPFGSLEDEIAVYRRWGWSYEEKQLPRRAPDPQAFVRWEDNHYESEADSAEALLLMAIRTGQRGYFDAGEAWARYHANLHAWRTDGWVYDDGAIWFPQGGPLGTKPARRPAEVKYEHWDKGSPDDRELWHLVQAKSCYCHFYGAGLVDLFLLTGERDFLEAAVDLVEQKNSEYRKHRPFTPGRTTISDTRGFGRGFYVITRVLEARPGDAFVGDLARLCRDVLWQCPDLDERGFAPCHLGTGFGGFDPKRDLPAEMRAFMEREGVTMDERGWLTDRSGRRWPVVCLGGTWQHFYVQAAAERFARVTGDEGMADFAVAFGRFAARHLLSAKCHQTWYYAYMDVPVRGEAWDPWRFQPAHTATRDGDGCVHDGYYTRFFPDAIAKAFSLAGDPALLDRAREFWHYGSKRGYQRPRLSAGPDRVGMFANHVPPKDDSALSTARLFHEWAHPRTDTDPPEVIGDLRVMRLDSGRVELRFTAPADRGGGHVARYQVKFAPLPIVADAGFDFVRDSGARRSFWRAENVGGEPLPSKPGKSERFTVQCPDATGTVHFAVAAFDDSNNRSAPATASCGEPEHR